MNYISTTINNFLLVSKSELIASIFNLKIFQINLVKSILRTGEVIVKCI